MGKLIKTLFENFKDRISEKISRSEIEKLLRKEGFVRGNGLLADLKTAYLIHRAKNMEIDQPGGYHLHWIRLEETNDGAYECVFHKDFAHY